MGASASRGAGRRVSGCKWWSLCYYVASLFRSDWEPNMNLRLGGHPMNRALMLLAVLAVAITTFAVPAFAGVGLRGGLSLEPDNFLVGLHWRSSPLGESVYFVPSVEAGFGDATMVAGNADFHYLFKTSSDLAPYVGGGATLNWFDFDGGSETDFGGSILGGIRLSPKMFLEAKIGLGDVPDWKFIVGWNAK